MAGKDNKQVIKLSIKDFTHLGSGSVREHQSVEIGHVDWILGASVDTSAETNNVKHLGVYVKCKNDSRSNLWSCVASIRFTLVKLNSNNKNDGFSMDFERKFDVNNKILKIADFKNWEEAICYDNSFVLDKEAVIRAEITVKNVVGIHEKILETFEKPREYLTDAVLIVEGKKVYVGKQILSQHSDYFNALFTSKNGAGDEEIVIEDVNHSEFVDLLNLIYPTHKEITDNNVGSLLKLSDRFKVPNMLFHCEDHLVYSEKIGIVDKLKFAEMYKLSVLQDHCLNQIKTNQDVLKMATDKNYISLDGITHTVVLQKLIDVLNAQK